MVALIAVAGVTLTVITTATALAIMTVAVTTNPPAPRAGLE